MRIFVMLLQAMALVVVAWPGAANEKSREGKAIVEAYNLRDLGAPGWRRVRLELFDGSTVTRTLNLVNAWHNAGGELRTLFFLAGPPGLRGTAYLLREHPEAGKGDLPDRGMQVHLYLPAGKRRVLQLSNALLGEGLLGSDFTYVDLRWRIPTAGSEFRIVGRSQILGRDCSVVERRTAGDGRPGTSRWPVVRYHLTDAPTVLLGVDYYTTVADGPDSNPDKSMRVHGADEADGVWTPTHMTMVSQGRRRSVLTLQAIRVRESVLDEQAFQPEALPTLGGRLERSQLGRPDGPERPDRREGPK